MRRRCLIEGNGIVSASKSSACDVCLYDKTNDTLVIVKYDDFSVVSYPSSNYSPVGVVVVPGTHDVYGTGECGVMSLRSMSCDYPDDGEDTNNKMYWGQPSSSSLTSHPYNYVYGYMSTDNTYRVENVYKNIDVYLPSDCFTSLQNPNDKDTYWFNPGWSHYIGFSPYTENDGRNSDYYRNDYEYGKCCLSDFNGKQNTEDFAGGMTSYWDNGGKIINQASYFYRPAFYVCLRYHTDGTKKKDWYLPACGEVGYLIPKLNRIQRSITMLKDAYGIGVELEITDSSGLWTSTEYDVNYTPKFARLISLKDGMVTAGKKDFNRNVRAFLRVK